MEKISFSNDEFISLSKMNTQPSYLEDWILSINRELKALNLYSNNSHFSDINSALRNDSPVDYQNADIIRDIDKIFDTMPAKYRVSRPETVYRGISLDSLPENLKNTLTKQPGADNCFTDKAFVSTSYDKHAAKRFKGNNGILLKITLPKNSKRIDINDLAYGNLFSNEEEVLLPRNSEFRVESYNPDSKVAELTFLGQKQPLPPVKETSGKAFNDEAYMSELYTRSMLEKKSVKPIPDEKF